MTITVEHIWRACWGKARGRGVSEHGGMLVCALGTSRSTAAGPDPVTGGRGFGAVPCHGLALLRSPSSQDNGGPQAAPQRGRFGGGAVGGETRACLIGSNVKVTAGVYKGYKGKVVDRDRDHRSRGAAAGRGPRLQRTQIAQPGAAPVASSYGVAPTASSVGSSFQPPARAPPAPPDHPLLTTGP